MQRDREPSAVGWRATRALDEAAAEEAEVGPAEDGEGVMAGLAMRVHLQAQSSQRDNLVR
jgi:hypothetical protein